MPCDVVPCDVVPCDVVPCDVVLCDDEGTGEAAVKHIHTFVYKRNAGINKMHKTNHLGMRFLMIMCLKNKMLVMMSACPLTALNCTPKWQAKSFLHIHTCLLLVQ